jgi:hypothetical protein
MKEFDTYILRRFLLSFLLACGFMTSHSAVVRSLSPLKQPQQHLHVERLFDHEHITLPFIENDYVDAEAGGDLSLFLKTWQLPRKRKYILNTASPLSSHTTRFIQLQLNLEFYIPEQENKTGVYQQQRAFLPAYYSFLSRYTPF